MSEQEAVGSADGGAEPGPTMPELLTMAADVVSMVDGLVRSADVGHGIVSVHVMTQAAAEYLAWRLALDQVNEFEPTRSCHRFAVWSGGEWPQAEFRVFCRGDLNYPLRTFPRRDLHTVAQTATLPGAA